MTAAYRNNAVLPGENILRTKKSFFGILPFLLASGHPAVRKNFLRLNRERCASVPCRHYAGVYVASYFVIPAKDFGEPFSALRYAHGAE